ncbi:MAG TPA: S8 family serine peptidase [Candidatus Deferrimicrobium sp.]|nr:S8 family serine peptidase [Candidatus Deferrimicrobium sp.]
MRFCKNILAVFILLLPILALSGEVDKNLTNRVSGRAAHELVDVWITLPARLEPRAFKAAVVSQAATARGRYKFALGRLRDEHAQAQSRLLGRLRDLERLRQADNVKAHWLANIVEARVAVGQLQALANRPDVDVIYAIPKITLITPEQVSPEPVPAAALPLNLKAINADDAWAAGYTGAGRVVCSFDSGIRGDHPALINNWKGHDGDSAAAWFDPRDRLLFPHTIPGPSASHGTHVMGILVGHDDVAGETTGVALDAKWISAAVIDVPGTSIIDAFEWAADPDGDPNSMGDVPDVINHSWGVEGIACLNLFYDLIDNLEVLGIVNTFSAGNEGSTGTTIRNPANRANDSLDCFAVGNVNHTANPPVIYGTSSRGPSDCNGAIKPNVTAPGYIIRSTLPNTTYGVMTGTSMAAPHVSGLVALLRQKNPNATVDEIKQAILTTAQDYTYTLPDNNYGWGVIDCMAALNALSSVNPTPNVRVYAFDHPAIAAGDTVSGRIVLQNLGADATSVNGLITGSNPSLTVLNNLASFGNVGEGDTVRSVNIVRVVVSDTVTEGSILALDFLITGDGGYSKSTKLYFVVQPRNQRLFVTHTTDRLAFTVSNFGTYGLGSSSWFPAGGLGFTFDGGFNDLYESGLMIGISSSQISDGVRNLAGEPDGDFGVLPGGNIELVEPGAAASQQTFSRFSDARAENPVGLEISQQTYTFAWPPYDDFVLLMFTLKNTNAFTVSSLYCGLYFDWDIVNFGSNAGGWNSADSAGWMAYNNGLSLSRYRAVRLLAGQLATAYTALSNLVTFPNGYTELEKYTSLRAGFGSATTYSNAQLDLLHVIAAGPLSLGAGQVDTVAFAVMGGNSQSEISAASERVRQVYDRLAGGCCRDGCGNVDGDPADIVNVADVTFLVSYMFLGGAAPICTEEANVDGDENQRINIADLTYLISYLWQGGPPPVYCALVFPN